MSIDARVDEVVIHHDGTGELILKDRPAKPGRGPEGTGIAGQTVLFFDKAPSDVWRLGGKDVWGGVDDIMLGNTRIAERDGYTKIRFVVGAISEALGKDEPSTSSGTVHLT